MTVSHSALVEGTFVKCTWGTRGGRKVTEPHAEIAEQAKGSPRR